MSVASAIDAIKTFLKEPEPEVLVLKGKWGTGKTFAWIKTLNEVNSENDLSRKKYAYISLFGIDSIESIRQAIIEETIDTDYIPEQEISKLYTIKNGPENTDTRNSSKDNSKRRCFSVDNLMNSGKFTVQKLMPLAKQIPFTKAYAEVASSLLWLSVKDTIICFDDLERMGDKLLLRKFQGLVNFLKEQRNCKIILIFNDDKIERKAFAKYREKIVDIEIEFSPSTQECIEIVFEKVEGITRKHARGLSEKLRINNIRILHRIMRALDKVPDFTDDQCGETSRHISHSIVLFTWCFLNKDGSSPPIEYVRTRNYYSHILGPSNKDEIPETEKKWIQILEDYGFIFWNSLDEILFQLISNGYIDTNAFNAEIEIMQNNIADSITNQKMIDAWNCYHESFEDNEDEVIKEFLSYFQDNTDRLSPRNADAMIKVLRELDRGDLADEMIDKYITTNKTKILDKKFQEYSIENDVQDSSFRTAISDHIAKNTVKPTLLETIDRISGEDGWNPEDEEILDGCKDEELYSILKHTNGKKLKSFINILLVFTRLGNASARQKNIGEKVIRILERIGRESKLNRLRVGKYGITVNNTDQQHTGNTQKTEGH